MKDMPPVRLTALLSPLKGYRERVYFALFMPLALPAVSERLSPEALPKTMVIFFAFRASVAEGGKLKEIPQVQAGWDCH